VTRTRRDVDELRLDINWDDAERLDCVYHK
jgi:hypothetical protein